MAETILLVKFALLRKMSIFNFSDKTRVQKGHPIPAMQDESLLQERFTRVKPYFQDKICLKYIPFKNGWISRAISISDLTAEKPVPNDHPPLSLSPSLLLSRDNNPASLGDAWTLVFSSLATVCERDEIVTAAAYRGQRASSL